MRERLLFGNWEHDDDPNALFGIDALHDLFTNTAEGSDQKLLTVDVARLGDDKTVACVWQGLKVIAIRTMNKSGTDEVTTLIRELCAAHQIRLSHVIVDEDGVSGGVIDILKRACKGFIGGASLTEPDRGQAHVQGPLRQPAGAALLHALLPRRPRQGGDWH